MRASILGAVLIGPFAALSISGCAGEAMPSGPPVTSPEKLDCSLGASCDAVDLECVGLVDNAGESRFGLRISQLEITRPPPLATGLLARIVASDAMPQNLACNLDGAGTFSWLLRFDTAVGTLETGGARPVTDAASGYRFLDGWVSGRHLAPVTYPITTGKDGSFSVAQGQDLTIPIYLDAAGVELVAVPLTAARFTAGTLSGSHNCIGRYNAAGLDPANDCFADGASRAFVNGASVEGLLTLEDADLTIVPSAAESLCVRLSGDAGTYGVTNAAGVTVCRRDAAGRIVLRGDACSTPGQDCADAFSVSADFAASSVRIND